ncbi:MAG: ABC transporter ATP-binding protein [Acidimicrobiia bacterium]
MYDPAPYRQRAVALEARDVSVRRCGHSLVQRVSLTAERGELLVLLGGVGSGTSTLLELLAGRIDLDAGRVLVDGRAPLDLADASPMVAYAHGAHACTALLDHTTSRGAQERGAIALLDPSTEGLDEATARHLLARCRAAADDGHSIVVTLDSAGLAATYATTVALFVAGRLLSWGPPAVALVPALQLLGDAGHRVH